MALYFKDTEITNIDNLVPQSGLDITDLWFGSTNVYTVWKTYEGTLPATLNANGDDMKQYQIYGNTGGVGDRTAQLFDKNANNADNGYVNSAGLFEDGRVQSGSGWVSSFISEYIAISPNKSYILKNAVGNNAAFCIYDSNKTYIWGQKYANISAINFNSGDGAYFIRLTVNKAQNKDTFMLTEGTTPPTTYVPFGYEVDISTSDGTNTTITPIYIGNEPLGKDEYIDYQAGRIYRRTANEFNKDNAAVYNAYINSNSSKWIYAGDGSKTVKMPCLPRTQYTLSVPSVLSVFRIAESENSDIEPTTGGSTISIITLNANSKYTFTTAQNTQCLIFQGNGVLFDEWFNGLMLVKGNTAPETYIPYLHPTDPPVPLPALPTCQGATVVDYAGESQVTPEKVLLKYRKE